ncbi:unnamed protein product, partial [Brenthis ino]
MTDSASLPSHTNVRVSVQCTCTDRALVAMRAPPHTARPRPPPSPLSCPRTPTLSGPGVTANTNFNHTIKRQLMFAGKNISDDKLIVSPSSFIYNHEFSPEDNKEILRMPPRYYPPRERQLNLKVIDMIRQQIYATQDRIRRLDPVIEKYKNDPSFRMAFIYNRLHQLIIDMRRIYTQALRWRERSKRVVDHIIWYSHCFRKYIDVLYIVEYVIAEHTKYSKMFIEGK